MKIGYARVSRKDQNLELQLDALAKEGCELIFQEKMSGAKESRKQLNDMLSKLRKGDIVCVWKLDRIARSLKHLTELGDFFRKNEIDFQCLNPAMDTSTPSGRLIFNVLGAIAEFERDLTIERTMAGLDNARKKGKRIGRPVGLSQNRLKVAMMAKSLKNEGYSIAEIADKLKIGRTSIYRYLKYVNAA